MIESFVMNNVNNDKILNVEIPEYSMYVINFCKYTSYMVTYTFASSIELPTRIRLRIHESPARAKTAGMWKMQLWQFEWIPNTCMWLIHKNVRMWAFLIAKVLRVLVSQPSPQLWACYTAIQITCWSYKRVSQNVGEGRKTYSQFKPHRFICCSWFSSSMFIFSFRPLLSFHWTNKTTNILRLLRDFKRKPQI